MPWKVIGTITAVPATPVRLTVGQANPAAAYPCQQVRVEALIANTGAVKVGDATIVASTDVGVAASLIKPAATGPAAVYEVADNGGQNGLNLSDFYIDAANADKVFVSIVIT
jgi:hypothetical protein